MSTPVDLGSLRGDQVTMETLEKQLICPICLEVFTKPVVILPCQHNLCRRCANELYQPSLFQVRTTMVLSSGRFRCPTCRQEVVLDRHGVYGLPRNLLVENIIDLYREQLSCSAPCPSPRSPSPPLPAGGSQVAMTCVDHQGERVNIYCVSCQQPTCSLCKVFGAHQSHQVAPLSQVYQQKKDELNEGLGSLMAFNNKVQTFISDLEDACRHIQENSQEQKQQLCEKFDRMFSILQERRKVMSERISSEQEEKTGHVQALLCCYGDNMDTNSKLLETAAQSMEQPDMAAFVQSSKELIPKVVSASMCPLEPARPGYQKMNQYRYNFSRQEEVLQDLDFIAEKEDVPEEVQPEPELQQEEPKHLLEPTAQNSDPKHLSELEPDPVSSSPPAPVQVAAPGPPPVPAPGPAPGPPLVSVEAPAARTEPQGVQDQRVGLWKGKEGQQGGRAERRAASDAVTDGRFFEEVGMTTTQAVTMVFYLLVVMVILQRVWAYLGCFIST